MIPRHLAKLPLLLLLGLTALVGCQTPSTVSEIQFLITVPPETPAGTTLRIHGEDPAFISQPLTVAGSGVFTTTVRLPRDQELRFHVKLFTPTDEQRDLDLGGALVPPRTFTAKKDTERVKLTVERWGPASGAPARQTVFLVSAPANTPAGDTLWLSGNRPELGEWNGAEVKLYKAVDDQYAGAVSFAEGTSLEFKVTRGGWDKVEKGLNGQEVSNHTHKTGAGYERVSVSVGGWADLNEPTPIEPTLTGNVRYELDVTPNNGLKKRHLIVWLPPGYETDTSRRYPVLYMHDGQNVMDEATGFGAQEWGVDETAQQLVTARQVEPLIIVGVYNTSDRVAEYTQVPFAPDYPEAGRADAYGAFLVEQVLPLINGKYRTLTGPDDTGLAGSSVGGLVTMYLGMKYPDTFHQLGVVSPSVWWAHRDILTKVDALPGKLPLRIWVDIGTDEGSSDQAETVADAKALSDALTAKGWTSADLKYTVVVGGQHNEAAWKERFGDILRFLFPKR